MTIIDPRATVLISPAPSVPVPTRPVAGVVQQIGAFAQQELAAYQDRQDDQILRRARMDAVERLGQLRIDADQDTGFADLGERFDARAIAVQNELRQSLPGHLQGDFDNAFDEVARPHRLGVRQRSVAGVRDAQRAELSADLEAFNTQMGGAADDVTRDGYLAAAEDALRSAVASGLITSEEAADRIALMDQTRDRSAILRGLRETPLATVDALRDGRFNVDPVQRERFIGQGQASIDREAARAERAAEAAEAERVRDIGNQVRVARSLLMAGQDVSDLDLLRADAAGTEHEAPLEAAIAATTRLGDFAGMTPQQQLEALRGLDPIASSDQTAQFEMQVRRDLLDIHEATIEALVSDPLAHVAGLGETDLTSLRAESLADASAMRQRISQAQAVADRWGTQVRFFTNAERDAFAEQIENGNADQRLAFAGTIATAFGRNAAQAAAELGEVSPVFGLGGQLVARGQLQTARHLFQGEALIGERGALRPKAADVRAVTVPIFQGAFRQNDPTAQVLVDAAEMHFAATASTLLESDGVLMSDRAQEGFLQSLQAVAGQTTVNGRAFGGFQSVNGQMALLPPNVTASTVEQSILVASEEAWRAASLSGGAPAGIAGQYLPRDAILVDVGGGAYLVQQRRSGSTVTLMDSDTGGPFLIDLARLIEASDRGPSDLTGPARAPQGPGGMSR